MDLTKLKKRWREFVSDFKTTTYRGDRKAFEEICEFFEKLDRYTEDEWKKEEGDDHRVVFVKTPEKLTMFNRGEYFKAIIEYSESDGRVVVAVGNDEGAREVDRYKALMKKIDAYITDEGIAVREQKAT